MEREAGRHQQFSTRKKDHHEQVFPFQDVAKILLLGEDDVELRMKRVCENAELFKNKNYDAQWVFEIDA